MATEDLDLGSLPRAELLRLYKTHASYDVLYSVASCRTFIAVARCLLAVPVRRSAFGSRGEEIEVAPEIVEAQLAAAVRWHHGHQHATSLPIARRPDPDWRETY